MRDAAKEASAEVRQPEAERAAEKKAPETALPAEPEAVKTEAPVRDEKARNSRGGRRRGRPHKEAQDSGKDVPAETGAETVKEEKPAVSEGKEEKPAVPEVKEEKPVKTAPKEESADTPAKKEKEAKAPAVRNNKVPDEPARVTVTVHDVPMVTHAVPQAKPERSPAASRIQAALSEKKVDAAVSRKVQSIVQKHEGEKNSRQAIYSEIRRTFGQKMGVDLYNSVKGLLK